MEFIEARVPESAYVTLIADGKAQGLYEQFGFQETAPRSVGRAPRPAVVPKASPPASAQA